MVDAGIYSSGLIEEMEIEASKRRLRNRDDSSDDEEDYQPTTEPDEIRLRFQDRVVCDQQYPSTFAAEKRDLPPEKTMGRPMGHLLKLLRDVETRRINGHDTEDTEDYGDFVDGDSSKVDDGFRPRERAPYGKKIARVNKRLRTEKKESKKLFDSAVTYKVYGLDVDTDTEDEDEEARASRPTPSHDQLGKMSFPINKMWSGTAFLKRIGAVVYRGALKPDEVETAIKLMEGWCDSNPVWQRFGMQNSFCKKGILKGMGASMMNARGYVATRPAIGNAAAAAYGLPVTTDGALNPYLILSMDTVGIIKKEWQDLPPHPILGKNIMTGRHMDGGSVLHCDHTDYDPFFPSFDLQYYQGFVTLKKQVVKYLNIPGYRGFD